jgi:hypothetical protein
MKSGRTTGVTEGRIIDANARTGELKYPGGTKYGFENCLIVESEDVDENSLVGGDSGSLLVDAEDQSALRLLFA